MEIKEIEIEKIKSDPNQPRKIFNEENLKQLAITYKA
jgi:ParB-like chromosome segregation protein Spo0J